MSFMSFTSRNLLFNFGFLAAWGMVLAGYFPDAATLPDPLPPPQSHVIIQELDSDDDV